MAEVNFGQVFGILRKEGAKPCEGEELGYTDKKTNRGICEAEGTHKVEVHFSPDDWYLCEECYEVAKAISEMDYRDIL